MEAQPKLDVLNGKRIKDSTAAKRLEKFLTSPHAGGVSETVLFQLKIVLGHLKGVPAGDASEP